MPKFSNFFKDRNDINEKTVIGFISFCIMFMFAVADLVTGFMGKTLPIHQYIYESFLVLTLGVFGISSVDKYINKKHSDSDISEDDTTDETTEETSDNTDDKTS